MSPVRYQLGFYIPEDDILHNHRRENLKSYTLLYVFGNFRYMTVLSLHLRNSYGRFVSVVGGKTLWKREDSVAYSVEILVSYSVKCLSV
jgi:hypothetical protein